MRATIYALPAAAGREEIATRMSEHSVQRLPGEEHARRPGSPPALDTLRGPHP